jgi:hypothetical protein
LELCVLNSLFPVEKTTRHFSTRLRLALHRTPIGGNDNQQCFQQSKFFIQSVETLPVMPAHTTQVHTPLSFFYHFESEQSRDVLDWTFEVAIEGNAVPAPLVPELKQLVNIAFRLSS